MNDLITKDQQELELSLMEETDEKKIKDIIDIFNLNIQKKNAIRNNKLSNLQDKIYEQMNSRIEIMGNNFTNKDLLDYFKVIQDTIDKNKLESQDVKMPSIMINQQNNINVNPDIDQASRKRIAEAVAMLMNPANREVIYDNSSTNEF